MIRTRLALGLVFATAMALSASSAQGAEPVVRNVLFIALEDWNASVLGVEGKTPVQTPHLDQLAAEGVRFTRAYCQGTVCNPSKASFLTGRYPTETGVFGNAEPFEPSLPEGVRTLPELLREGRPDLHLANVSKLCLQPVFAQRTLSAFHRLELVDLPDPFTGISRGFTLPAHRQPRDAGFQFTADPELEARLVAAFQRRNELDAVTPKDAPNRWDLVEKEYQLLHSELVGDSGRSEAFEPDGRVARCAAGILDEWGPAAPPFFLSLTFAKPHTPLLCPREYVDLYDPATIPPPAAPVESDRDVPDVARRWGQNWDVFNQVEPSPERQRATVAAYYACASFIDAQIGLVLAALEDSGHADDTAVIVFADHGFHLGEHGLWSKLTLFEQSTRVPLLVRLPGAAKGATCDALVELVDFLPTVCELTGVPAPTDLPGKSLVPLLRDPTASLGREAAFTFLPIGEKGLASSVRTLRYRYTEWRHENGSLEHELYDLEVDPWEQNNLAPAASQPEVLARMQSLLERFRAEHPLRGRAAPLAAGVHSPR